MSRPNPANQAMRDALIEVLRAADFPLTTAEVISRAFADGGRTYAYYGRVYSTLRTMANTELVIWHAWGSEVGGHQRTVWAIGPKAPPAIALDELESIWESS